MNTLEHTPSHSPEDYHPIAHLDFEPDFGLKELAGFDVDAAFQGAVSDVISDEELALDEKIQRMESIVTEASSDMYREFVDFRAMAATVQMQCAHDHSLNQALEGNDFLSNFQNTFESDAGHNHDDASHDGHDHHADDDEEIDPKTGRKKRKKRSRWAGRLATRK